MEVEVEGAGMSLLLLVLGAVGAVGAVGVVKHARDIKEAATGLSH